MDGDGMSLSVSGLPCDHSLLLLFDCPIVLVCSKGNRVGGGDAGHSSDSLARIGWLLFNSRCRERIGGSNRPFDRELSGTY